MIIDIREINLHNSFAVSRFVDHLINILKIQLVERTKEKMKILSRIQIVLPNAVFADRILKLQ